MPINEIIPGLFLSAYADTINKHDLFALGITHVINLSQIPSKHSNSFQVYEINVSDYPETDISQYFTQTSRFITNSLIYQKKVLVYCFWGMSRSVSIVVAFLIKKRHMSFQDAMELVKEKRPCAEPNSGFIEQLQAIDVVIKESCGNALVESPLCNEDI